MSDAATSPAAVTARGWGWRHATRRAWAVREASFRIEPGEHVLLLGASGAGKSTLLHGIAGVLGGDEEGESTGSLLVDGEEPEAIRGRVGLVLQDPESNVILARVGDDVAFGLENLGVPREEIWPRVDEALRAVGLEVARDRSTAHLSGGQKQRLALAGVLAMRPGLIVLDEPTANLDPEGVREVRDAVVRAARSSGATLVVVEHRVETWLPVVDRVLVLGPEGIVADGDPDAVFAERGEELAALGAWVPGHPPAEPAPPAAAPGDVLLSAVDLAVARVRDEPVASGIDAAISAGEAVAITGPNGAGKSTLGLTLAGLLPAHAGAVRASRALAGDLGSDPMRWRSRDLLTRIGTVFQAPEHQLLTRTVRDELAVGPRALGLGADAVDERVDELLERLRLAPLARANPYTLSGGEKRRLTVAAALATAPRVLVLDEPTFGQDASTWADLVALLARLRDEGSAIVAITHDADVVRALHARTIALGARGGRSDGGIA